MIKTTEFSKRISSAHTMAWEKYTVEPVMVGGRNNQRQQENTQCAALMASVLHLFHCALFSPYRIHGYFLFLNSAYTRYTRGFFVRFADIENSTPKVSPKPPRLHPLHRNALTRHTHWYFVPRGWIFYLYWCSWSAHVLCMHTCAHMPAPHDCACMHACRLKFL